MRYVGARRFDKLTRVTATDDGGFPDISLASDRGFRRFPVSPRRRRLAQRRVRNCVHVFEGGKTWTDYGWEYDYWCKHCGWQGGDA